MSDPYDPIPDDAYPSRTWDDEGKQHLEELMTEWLNVGFDEFWVAISGLLTMYDMSASDMVDAMTEAARDYFSTGLEADYEQSQSPSQMGWVGKGGRP